MSVRVAPLHLHVLFLGAAVAAALAGCAAAGPYNPAALAPARLAQVGETCRAMVGVKPGFTAYDNCVESLSGSAARLDHIVAVAAADGACEGGPGRCELDAAVRSGPEAPQRPYAMASSREVRRREQAACARLGYDRVSGGFAACVASLDAALYAADHPQP